MDVAVPQLQPGGRRLYHLDQVCDCQVPGLRLRQGPFSPQVVAPRVGLVSPASILPRAEPPC